MDPKDIERLIQGTKKPSPINGMANILKQMQFIGGYLQHLEQSLIAMSHEVQAQGLGFQMIIKILLENNVCTEEELNKYHTEYVVKPMNEAMDAIQKKIEEAEEAAKAAHEATVTEPTIESNEQDSNSDVVLASERASNVVRFPSGK